MKRSGPIPRRTPLAPVSAKRLAAGGPAGLQRYSTLQSGGQLARVTALRPVSKSRAAENRVRRSLARQLWPVGEEPPCEVTVRRANADLLPLAVCTGWADDIHESISRARSSGLITDPSIWCAVCRGCHTYITDYEPDWAYELGLLVESGPVRKPINKVAGLTRAAAPNPLSERQADG